MAFRSQGTAVSLGNGVSGSMTPGTPAGAAANDILFIFSSQDGGGATTYTWPSGFTELFNSHFTTPDGQAIAVAWKRAVGGDSLAVSRSSTTGSWVLRCLAFSGRDTGNPPVGSTAATNTASNASPTTVTANGVTALAGDDLLWIGGLDVTAATSSSTFTQPTGYTSQGVTIDSSDHFDVVGIATKDNVSAGATGSVAGTLTHSGSAGWAAFLIRIPAAAAGGAMVGESDGTSSVSGTLTGAGALAASESVAASVTAGLTGAGALNASESGTASVSATASGAGAFAASISVSASESSTLTGAGALNASESGAGSITAALAGAGALSTAIAGSSTVSLNNSATSPIQSAISCTASISASLSGSGAITAGENGSVSVSGLLVGAGALSVSVSGSGQLTATATGAGKLAGVITGTALVSLETIPIATFVSYSSIQVVPTLTGSISAKFTLTGSIKAVQSLSGTVKVIE